MDRACKTVPYQHLVVTGLLPDLSTDIMILTFAPEDRCGRFAITMPN